MDAHPPVGEGFVRIRVRLPRGESYTPGDLVRLAGIPIDQLGPIAVEAGEALVDVRGALGRDARAHLEKIGPTALTGWGWRWLKINLGRNHGVAIGQLRKILTQADAMPVGKLMLNNTHSMVGIQDFRLAQVQERLSAMRVNGFAVRCEQLPPGKGPGSPEFIPGGRANY